MHRDSTIRVIEAILGILPTPTHVSQFEYGVFIFQMSQTLLPAPENPGRLFVWGFFNNPKCFQNPSSLWPIQPRLGLNLTGDDLYRSRY